MSENFNVSPYYDDFDPSKNYHRILFRPGRAVQARELTQSQTILQNQISNFADNIFTQNTPVSGGKITTNLSCSYIKLVATFGTSTISVSNFLNADGSGRYITDAATGSVIAKVITVVESTLADPPTLIVSYLSGVQFTDATVIQTNDGGTQYQATTIGSTGGTTCTGLSSVVSISSGVFYVVNGYSKTAVGTNYSIGNFVQVNPQTVVLSKYSNIPTARVGLAITENIIDYTSDSSLLDPAIGASNYQAPGADRYQITLSLTYLPLALGNDSNFIELVRINAGQIVSQVDGTVYSTIDDYFAKRDYETNGDYLVTPFTFTPSANVYNSAQYDLTVSKGIAYVHGYRIENQSPLKLTTDRARSTVSINNNDVFVDVGSYFYVDTMHGFFNVTNMPQIDLHCIPANNIVTTSNTTYNATKIGTAYIRNLVYVQDNGSSNTWVYKAYVSDINTNSFSSNVAFSTSQTTITLYDPQNKLSAVSNAYYGMTLTVLSGTSAGDVRNIIYYNATSFIVDKPFTITPDSTSVISVSPSIGTIESLVIPGSSNNVVSSVNINTPFGKQSGVFTGNTLLENGANPEMIFKIGNPYVGSVTNSTYQSTKTYSPGSTGVSGTFNISAGTDLNFVGVASSLQSASIIKQYYIVIDASTGLILDYTVAGASVSLDSNKQTLTFTNPAYANKTVYVIASVTITNGDSFPILKWKNLVTGSNTQVTSPDLTSYKVVTGDSNTAIDLQLGQAIIQYAGTGTGKISLRVADLKNITAIYDTGSKSVQPVFSGLSSYTDVTGQYLFDNGQRDNFYDHANIQLLPGANPAAGNLLVIFNYYSHINGAIGAAALGTGTSSDGYFAIGSYLNSTYPDTISNIPSYKAKDGNIYNLGDCLDFRPSRVNGTTTFSFEYASSGALMPTDLSLFASTYSYYLGRKDLLVLSKDKSFQIIEGNPSLNPIFPSQPTGSLVLANLTLDPYTSYVPGENPIGKAANLSINPVSHNRWAKSDISDLQTRVNNLEYYTSLSLLEQNAQSLQIPDINGLNRFKNGILVDDFSSFGTADTFNPDFTANINIRLQKLGPIALVDNLQLQNPIVHDSIGTLKQTNTFAVSSLGGSDTNIFTLPYTTANLVSQPLASNTVSLNPFAVSVYQGVASLLPPMDNWVDTIRAPALLITDPNMQVFQQSAGVNLTNSGDFATIPGTAYSTTTSVSVTNHGDPNVNSPFGSAVGYTATTTNTYASQLQNISTTLNQTSVNSTLSTSNGYLTNISMLPYIRQQQLGFYTQGLLVNAPVSVWFDGKNVNQYVTLPNTIELTNVSGSFSVGDVVGFYVSAGGVFYPTGRVEGLYVYPGTNNVRLYVSSVTGAVPYSTSTKIQNGFYDANGNYTGNAANTAYGTINTGVTSIHSHGVTTGVGGGYTINGQTYQIYAVKDTSNWSSFMNQYAVWGDLNLSASYSASFVVTPQVAGIYKYVYATTGTTTIAANGSTILSTSTPNYNSQSTPLTFTVTSSQVGSPLTLSWSVTGGNATPAGTSGIALVVTDPNGNIVFTSTNPPQLSYTNSTGEAAMPQGGAWFTGVRSLQLDQNATANTQTYYQGAQITITSTYAYSFTTETATYVPPPPPSGGGGGGKIICKKLSELGYFDKEMNEADQRFGRELQSNDRLAYLGYIRWAQTVVELMDGQGSERLRKVILFWIKDKDRRIQIQQNIVCYYMDMLARPWAEEMAYRMRAKGHNKSNPAGKLIMDFGLPLCRKVGKIQSNAKLPLAAKILAIWGTVTVLLVGVVAVSGTNAIVNKVKSWFKKKPLVQAINS